MTVTVRTASAADVPALIPLFDAYRQFYGEASDPDLAGRFLTARLSNGESTVLLAEDESGAAIGFVQLYPSFTSAACARIYILNDIYVLPASRRGGCGTALLKEAAAFGKSMGAVRLKLSTALGNTQAQAAYEANGWKSNMDFVTYNLAL